ncbi:hypothetical protein [Streptomyces sp. R08]|uniref:Uncharacterized protein n=1 Tax=Streptomyces sp. R08 TaxID=3238624 RepID=A0AB39MC61_9ACTN
MPGTSSTEAQVPRLWTKVLAYQDPDQERANFAPKPGNLTRSCSSGAVGLVYHQQTKNLLVTYSPKKLGFF